MSKQFLKSLAALLASVMVLALFPAGMITDVSAAEPAPAAEGTGFYKVSGTKILDPEGKEIVLKGLSMGNNCWGDSEEPNANDHDEQSFKELADMGINCVRFELDYQWFEQDSNPYHYLDKGFEWFDEQISWAKKYGIGLIVSLKHPQGGYQASVEGWGGLEGETHKESYSGGKRLWMDEDGQGEKYKENQNRVVALYKEFAKRYKDEPTIIAFGLINEPVVPQQTTAELTTGIWKDLAQRIADAIRTEDQNHIIVVESLLSASNFNNYYATDWNQQTIENKQFLISDPQQNVMYETHFYEPLAYTTQGATWVGMENLTDVVMSYPSEDTVLNNGDNVDWNIAGVSTPVTKGQKVGNWQYFESTFTIGQDQLTQDWYYGTLQVTANNLGVGQSIYYDDLKLSEVIGGEEKTLYQYTFDEDLGQFQWGSWFNNGGSVTWSSSIDHSGNGGGSLQFIGATSSANDHGDFMYFKKGKTYKISGWQYDESDTNNQVEVSLRQMKSGEDGKIWTLNKEYLAYMFDRYTKFYLDNNVPIFIGEWGLMQSTYKENRGGEQYVKDLMDIINAKGLSSNCHSYHNETFGLYASQEWDTREGKKDEERYRLFTTYYTDPLKTLTITPDATEIVEGTAQTVTFTAAATGNSGKAVRIPYIEWNFAPEVAPAGVTYNEDGSVTVSAEAKPCEITVTATSGAGSDSKVITVTEKPAQIPTTITISRGDGVKTADTLVIPASGETVYTYTATVTDQEGKPIEAPEITWSLETADEFVTQEGGSVTVKAGATNDKTYTLKAVCGEAAAQVEITLKGLTITWPQITENSPEYGKKLSEMLTLDGGSATVNGETVDGTFTLNSADSVPDAGEVRYTINFKSTTDGYDIDSEERTVTVKPKPITVTVTPVSRVYGAENPAFDFTIDGALVGQDTKEGLGLTLGTEANAASDVGSYAVTVKAQTTTNYEVTVAENTALSVTAKELTASLTGSVTKVYDKTTAMPAEHSLEISLDGVVNGDELTASATFAYADATVGTGKSVTATGITVSGDKSKNYTLQENTASADLGEITPKELTASLDGTATKDYDGTTAYTGDDVTVKLEGVINDDTVTATAALAFDTADAGDGKIVTATGVTLSGEDAGNYTVKEGTLTTTGSITKAGAEAKSGSLAVTNSLAKIYEYDLAVLLPEIIAPRTFGTVSYELGTVSVAKEGYFSQEDVKIDGTQLTVSVKSVDSTAEESLGTVQVIIKSDNYNDMTATVTISAVNKTVVTITGVTKADAVYDGETHTGYTGTPAAEGYTGEFEIAYIGQRADGTDYSDTAAPVDAGTYTVTFTVPASDPEFTGSASLEFTVGPKPITVTVTPASREYGAANPAFDFTVPNGALVGSDTKEGLGLTLTSVADNTSDVGSYAVTKVAQTATNYEVTVAANTALSVTAKELTASLDGTATKEYDGITTYTGEGVTVKLEGVINNDTVTAAPGALTFDSADVGENKAVTATGVTLSGEDAGNYTVKEGTLTTTGSITKATATAKNATMNVTNNLTKTYEFDLTELLPEITPPKTLGTVTYALGTVSITKDGYVEESDVNVEGTKLTVTVKDVVSSVEGQIGTVQVTIKSDNYNDMTATVTISAVNKAVVTITGVTKADAVYDGEAHAGYTGTPAAGDYEGEFEIAYTGEKADNTQYSSTAAPVDAGTYTVTFTVPASDPEFTGSVSVQFTIAQKQLTWAGALTAYKQEGKQGETDVYGTPEVAGLVGQDRITVTGTGLMTSGFAEETEPGEYEVEAVPQGGSWTFDPAVPANYLLPTGNPKVTATVNKVENVNIETEDGEDPLRLEVETGLSDVPEALAEKPELDTPEEIAQALVEAAKSAGASGAEKNSVTLDVTLQIQKGGDWQDVTDSEFPSEGITVTLPYPEGTNGSYTFTVIHMHSNGSNAGNTENLPVTKGADGISFVVKSLSPICIAWTPPASAAPSAPTYIVGIAQAENGAVRADPLRATANGKVTLTVTPDDGFVLDSLTVTDSTGRTVTVTDNGDGTYTFTMPSGGVTVTAVFKCDGGEACPSRKFTDLDAKAWYHDYTDYVITADLMRGIGGGLFNPNGTVERAQMVTVLWHMQGDPVVNYAMAYSDVAEDDWYAEAVRWATSEGIAGGYDNGMFGPTDPITREQMAVMLYRYAKRYGGSGFDSDEPYELPFTDAAKVSDWAIEAAVWCSRKGILTGKDNNLLDPAGSAKRCEMAAILMRYCQRATAGEE